LRSDTVLTNGNKTWSHVNRDKINVVISQMIFLGQVAEHNRLEHKRNTNMKRMRYFFFIEEEANEPKFWLGSFKNVILYIKSWAKTLNTLLHIEDVPSFS
jgi:hypothetical protein